MEIRYLADAIDHAETVAGWIYEEFIRDIRHGVSYGKVLSNVRTCHKATLPVRMIAMEGDRCVGTVSIVKNDLACRDYTPWLAALYVEKVYRGNKIGERLIERVKHIAEELGYGEVYLRTEHASGYYRRLNWQFVESCTDEFGLIPDVFVYKLK